MCVCVYVRALLCVCGGGEVQAKVRGILSRKWLSRRKKNVEENEVRYFQAEGFREIYEIFGETRETLGHFQTKKLSVC